MNIAQHIDELLFEHDCVILPEFGGFVGDYIAAKINSESHVFMPPSKYVLFNRHLTNNDGLLINAIAKKEQVTYAEATESLKNFISEIKSELIANKRFEIGEIGVFYFDAENKVCFKHAGKNYSLANFGLPQFVMEPIVQEVKEVAEPVKTVEKTAKIIEISNVPKTVEDATRRRNYWWVAAALLPIAFYSTWIPLKTDLLTDSSKFQVSDLNPFTFQKAEREYSNHLTVQPNKVSEIEKVSEIPSDSYSTFQFDGSKTFIVKPLLEVEPVEVETTYVEQPNVAIEAPVSVVSELKRGYFVIGGCFSKKENADNMVEEYLGKGYNSEIVDVNKDLYRVAISKQSSRQEAKAIKDQLKDAGISTWILKK